MMIHLVWELDYMAEIKVFAVAISLPWNHSLNSVHRGITDIDRKVRRGLGILLADCLAWSDVLREPVPLALRVCTDVHYGWQFSSQKAHPRNVRLTDLQTVSERPTYFSV
jgi:hypothetical protein